jgi:hypothetical protein
MKDFSRILRTSGMPFEAVEADDTVARFLERSGGFGLWWRSWRDDAEIGEPIPVAQFRSATVEAPEQGPGVVQLIRCSGVIEKPGEQAVVDLGQRQHLGLVVCHDVGVTVENLSEQLQLADGDIILPVTPLEPPRFALAWRDAVPASLLGAANRLSDVLEPDSTVVHYPGHGPKLT